MPQTCSYPRMHTFTTVCSTSSTHPTPNHCDNHCDQSKLDCTDELQMEMEATHLQSTQNRGRGDDSAIRRINYLRATGLCQERQLALLTESLASQHELLHDLSSRIVQLADYLPFLDKLEPDVPAMHNVTQQIRALHYSLSNQKKEKQNQHTLKSPRKPVRALQESSSHSGGQRWQPAEAQKVQASSTVSPRPGNNHVSLQQPNQMRMKTHSRIYGTKGSATLHHSV